jgi:tetratricopeptide (TPR) repeat protein
MSADRAQPVKPRRSLFVLLGTLALLGVIYLSLPKSWFEIPEENPQAAPSRAQNAPGAQSAPDAATLDQMRLAVQNAPLDYALRSRYGVALAAAGRLAEAQEEFLTAIRLAPESPVVHHNLGLFYLNSNQPAKADAAFQRELELAPGDGRAHYFRGLALQSLRRYPEAAAQFEMAGKLAPALAEPYLSLATLLSENRPPEEIQGYVDIYLKRGGTNKGLAYHALSRSYRTKQNHAEAIRYAEMATKESPEMVMYWRNLGQLYSAARRFDEADKTLRKVTEMTRDPSPVFVEIAVNAQKAGRYPEAIEAYKRALEIRPQDGTIHLYLSRAYMLAGDMEASRREEQEFRRWERKNQEENLKRVRGAAPGNP